MKVYSEFEVPILRNYPEMGNGWMRSEDLLLFCMDGTERIGYFCHDIDMNMAEDILAFEKNSQKGLMVRGWSYIPECFEGEYDIEVRARVPGLIKEMFLNCEIISEKKVNNCIVDRIIKKNIFSKIGINELLVKINEKNFIKWAELIKIAEKEVLDSDEMTEDQECKCSEAG